MKCISRSVASSISGYSHAHPVLSSQLFPSPASLSILITPSSPNEGGKRGTETEGEREGERKLFASNGEHEAKYESL